MRERHGRRPFSLFTYLVNEGNELRYAFSDASHQARSVAAGLSYFRRIDMHDIRVGAQRNAGNLGRWEYHPGGAVRQ